ncbi:hypothetical protein L1987_28442 [Smallanthus sonchifolius]|uniref:Uncharacterized protein n=1 Tax=Smallanthus sonchifolius TaxID=185202 RepID=A0ACB9HZW7_9ASTR|nr:hypothetical protein L1987_28442 [Smallanthus sonchifolius]
MSNDNTIPRLIGIGSINIRQVIVFVNPEDVKEVHDRVRKCGYTPCTPELSDARKMSFYLSKERVHMVMNLDISVINPLAAEVEPDYEKYYKRTCRASSTDRRGIVFNVLRGDREIELMCKIKADHFKHDIAL